MLLRCAGDRTISLEIAWAANQTETQEFIVRGTDGGARLDLGGEELHLIESGQQGTDHVMESELTRGSLDTTGWKGSDERFLDAVVSGEPPEENTVERALTVQRVIDGIYRSAESGTSVSLDDE